MFFVMRTNYLSTFSQNQNLPEALSGDGRVSERTNSETLNRISFTSECLRQAE
jgi:hypothetical protein